MFSYKRKLGVYTPPCWAPLKKAKLDRNKENNDGSKMDTKLLYKIVNYYTFIYMCHSLQDTFQQLIRRKATHTLANF